MYAVISHIVEISDSPHQSRCSRLTRRPFCEIHLNDARLHIKRRGNAPRSIHAFSTRSKGPNPYVFMTTADSLEDAE